MSRRPLFGLLALCAFPLCAQAPVSPQAPADSFGEEIQVSVVNLDVFVSDKQGKPVEGLKAEDFVVTEDGRPVKVTNFYTEKREPARAADGKAAAERPQDQRLRLVVFLDDVNTGPGSRGRILDRLTGFLRQELVPGDEVMLVRYAQKLDVRRSFTSDLGQIESDLAVLKGEASDMKKYEESRDHAVDDVVDAIYAGDGWGPLAEGRIRAWAEQESAVVKGALAALDGVVSWLAGVPGRKAILYVSDGLPLAPGDDLFTWASLRSGFRAGRRISGMSGQEFDLSKRFREVTSHASRNRITIYPIEAYGTRVVRGTAIQEVLVANRQNGLRFLAEDTGGRAMLNAADPQAALRLMSEDLATYYSLGYTPERPGDEAEHKIEVKVKVKGAHVRHRQWYRDKPAGEAVAERTLAVMRFGPEDNPLGASLEIEPPKQQQNGATLVPVRVKVPIAKLYLQAQDPAQDPAKAKTRTGRLRLYVVASTGGATTPVKETKVVTVELPEAEAAAGTTREYVHDVGLPLQAGSWSIGVAVRDELAATTSYLRKDFTVPGVEKGR
ncbi:MAG TPA: VWA domain-containing protein [Thermoanaerobaculia bacterium]|nr:VWA domain-containing protein [Thermoanaerobaculia bacterium]